jgi:hypothetical protein
VSVTELAIYSRILVALAARCKKAGNLVYSVFAASSLASSNQEGETKMKRFVMAIALACALSGTALAGDVHSTGAEVAGDIHTTGAPAPGDIDSTDSPAPQASDSVVTTVLLTIISLVVR